MQQTLLCWLSSDTGGRINLRKVLLPVQVQCTSYAARSFIQKDVTEKRGPMFCPRFSLGGWGARLQSAYCAGLLLNGRCVRPLLCSCLCLEYMKQAGAYSHSLITSLKRLLYCSRCVGTVNNKALV